jgi:hypothetical protein
VEIAFPFGIRLVAWSPRRVPKPPLVTRRPAVGRLPYLCRCFLSLTTCATRSSIDSKPTCQTETVSARKKIARLKMADTATLFLDERRLSLVCNVGRTSRRGLWNSSDRSVCYVRDSKVCKLCEPHQLHSCLHQTRSFGCQKQPLSGGPYGHLPYGACSELVHVSWVFLP